ncbi:MAG: tRNA (adenosine(37)-N6)-threonylcarbamoyltransferase complex ATPase subunit type 1 TsaE [Nitrospirae bacterium]|nr:tRNA (adenosine(37)-N6)-threonylcarbamoyltransferase complex ATPase subunit type 1 TsaE [Nitrospirota bacterium]
MLHSRSESETKEIGMRLGSKLKAGDIVCLPGALGSGKTTMVKGMATAIGIDERDVASASFIIIAEYKGALPFYHIDLYRLDPDRISDIGLYEYLGRNGIAVIEWPENAGDEIPEKCIRVRLNYAGETERDIVIEGIEL